MWEGMQGSFKVLINSFYGYLGYGGGLFNDYDAAERVTLAGQRIVKQIVASLRQHDATPIEVDTDGVYFVPPPGVDTLRAGAGIHRRHRRRSPTGYSAWPRRPLRRHAVAPAEELRASLSRRRDVVEGQFSTQSPHGACFRRFLLTAARRFLQNERRPCVTITSPWPSGSVSAP